MPSGTWGRYLMSGHLVYLDKGTLFAVPFDPDALELRARPCACWTRSHTARHSVARRLTLSRTGTLVYRSSRAGQGLVTVQWVDSSDKTKPLLPVPGNYLSPTLSPDGSRLALTSAGDIWVYALGRGSMTRLTVGGGYTNPVWSADGRYIAFRAGRGMLWTRADGTAQPAVLSQSSNQQTPWSFSPDGKQLAFVEIDPPTGADIWTVPVETGPSGLRAGKPEVFLRTSLSRERPGVLARWALDRIHVQRIRRLPGVCESISAWSRQAPSLHGPRRLPGVVAKRHGNCSFGAWTPVAC